MNPRLYATIMLWSASTNPARLHAEDRVNRAYAAWLADPGGGSWMEKNVDHLRDCLNDIATDQGDRALLYDVDRQVIGIKPECLPDFREWCERYGMESGGL